MNDVKPPKTSDYSPAAIEKAVVSVGMLHPATIFPVAFGICAGFVGWLFDIWWLYLPMLAGFLAGPVSAIALIFLFHERSGSRYINRLNRQQKKYENHLKTLINHGFIECSNIDNLAPYAGQGIMQFKHITEKLENVHDLLDLKINGGEITYGRFLGAAEQVSLSVLDNLNVITGILKSAGSIHTDYVAQRIQKINAQDHKTEEDLKQLDALKKRETLYNEQIRKVTTLFTKNETAMTEMEKISAAVALWKTDKQFASTDFESAISKLQELADQAHEYN